MLATQHMLLQSPFRQLTVIPILIWWKTTTTTKTKPLNFAASSSPICSQCMHGSQPQLLLLCRNRHLVWKSWLDVAVHFSIRSFLDSVSTLQEVLHLPFDAVLLLPSQSGWSWSCNVGSTYQLLYFDWLQCNPARLSFFFSPIHLALAAMPPL